MCVCVIVTFPSFCLQLLSFTFVFADWKVLKNRKFLGAVSEQNIRTKSRPVIQEVQPQYVPLTASLSACTASKHDLCFEPGGFFFVLLLEKTQQLCDFFQTHCHSELQ